MNDRHFLRLPSILALAKIKSCMRRANATPIGIMISSGQSVNVSQESRVKSQESRVKSLSQ